MNSAYCLLSLLYTKSMVVSAAGDLLTFPLLHEASIRHRSLLESGDDALPRRRLAGTKRRSSPETIPTYQGYGAFYIDIYVGTPPQRQTVLIDSGSEKVAIPCKNCVDCGDGHTDEHFDHSLSESFQELACSQCFRGECDVGRDRCAATSSYAEGSSWKGIEVQDFIYPGGPHDEALDVVKTSNDDDTYSGVKPMSAAKYRFPLKFTCMESVEGAFKNQLADGIMGLSLRNGSFWSQMHEHDAMVSRQFSICMRKHPFTPQQTHAVGVMTLGGVDDRLHTSEMIFMEYTPIDMGMYGVHIRKIYVRPGGGEKLAGANADFNLSRGKNYLVDADESVINHGSVILDSGTTDTILSAGLKPHFDKAWEKVMRMPFPTEPVSITPDELMGWPTIIFQMKGSSHASNSSNSDARKLDKEHPNDVLVAFPPSHYMLFDIRKNVYLPRLHMHDTYGGR